MNVQSRTRRRILTGLTGIVAAVAIGVGAPASSFAYIPSCDDPVLMQLKITFKKGKPVTKVTLINAITGETLSSWDKDHVLYPDATEDGYFSVPVPGKFRGVKTRVSVQFVDYSGDALWMQASRTWQPWSGGGQVWLHSTITPSGESLQVGVPNSDVLSGVYDFKFEVTYSSTIKGKNVQESYLVAPGNLVSPDGGAVFGKWPWDSNGLTFLTLRQP